MSAASGVKTGRPTVARLRAELPTRCVQLFESWVRTGADLAYVGYPSRREVTFKETKSWGTFIARLEWTKRGKGPRVVIINKHTGVVVCASKFGNPWALDIGSVDLKSLPFEEDSYRAVRALQGLAVAS